jgi:hypothetical protein
MVVDIRPKRQDPLTTTKGLFTANVPALYNPTLTPFGF